MNIKKDIKHIFFDLDHTLWDFDKNSALAFQMIFKKHQISLDLETFLKVYKPINLQYWKLYREEQISKSSMRRRRLSDTFDQLNFQFSLQSIDQFSEDYINYLPLNNFLIHGAIEILEYLKPKYQLHIITNGFEEVQHKKLKKSGGDIYFETVTNSEEVGVKKPNPLIFEHALKKSGAEVNESIMIGDSYEADILGAENIGMRTIFFNYHGEKIPKKYDEVSNLMDIMQHL